MVHHIIIIIFIKSCQNATYNTQINSSLYTTYATLLLKSVLRLFVVCCLIYHKMAGMWENVVINNYTGDTATKLAATKRNQNKQQTRLEYILKVTSW